MEDYIRQRIGKTLGERWRLESVLGVGGMAAVYAAKDPAGQEAAVKVLHPEIGMRPEIRDRFMREGYVANKIQHPGVVQVLEHGAVDEWSVFLVMERLSGESLADRVTRQGTLPADELLSVLDQVLDVLAAAHAAGIVHRDLKPDNLFVLADGRIKVLDFGLARVLDGTPDDVRTRTGMAMGTMPYMAPEQALGKRSEIDGRVDLFALGATAFRILARRRIHESDSDAGMLVAMATSPAPLLRSVAPHVAEPLAMIIDLALAFNRDARYPDARSMQADVRAVRAGGPPAFALARRQTRDEPTRVGMAAPALVAPASAPASTGVPTVVARLDAPTAVAPFDAPTKVVQHDAPTAVGGFDAPTAVARLDLPTVVAPLDKPTAVGLGPPGPALAPPAHTQLASALPLESTALAPGEPLVSAVSVRGAPARPARSRGVWVALIVLGTASAGAAVLWATRAPDTNAGIADAAAESTPSEAAAAGEERPREAGGADSTLAASAPVSRTPTTSNATSSHASRTSSRADAPGAAPAPALATSGRPEAPTAEAGTDAARALSERSDAPDPQNSDPLTPSAPAAPTPAKTEASAPSGATASAPAPAADESDRRRGRGSPKGRPSKHDKGF